MAAAELKARERGGWVEVYRHPWVVRITHALNAVALLVLLTSGLQILNAHPALYWGETSRFDAAIVRFGAMPSWLTLPPYPDLGAGRAWHFAAAWLLVANLALYLAHGLASGRIARQLWPTRADLGHLGRSAWDHLRLKFPEGDAARHYNGLQKLAYLFVFALALPVMVMTGLAMSPTVHAAAPWLGDLFGGRQSARTVHFGMAMALVGFVVVHLAMVLAAGPLNELRAILTGWYRLKGRRDVA